MRATTDPLVTLLSLPKKVGDTTITLLPTVLPDAFTLPLSLALSDTLNPAEKMVCTVMHSFPVITLQRLALETGLSSPPLQRLVTLGVFDIEYANYQPHDWAGIGVALHIPTFTQPELWDEEPLVLFPASILRRQDVTPLRRIRWCIELNRWHGIGDDSPSIPDLYTYGRDAAVDALMQEKPRPKVPAPKRWFADWVRCYRSLSISPGTDYLSEAHCRARIPTPRLRPRYTYRPRHKNPQGEEQ